MFLSLDRVANIVFGLVEQAYHGNLDLLVWVVHVDLESTIWVKLQELRAYVPRIR